jgi:hypothetical protein
MKTTWDWVIEIATLLGTAIGVIAIATDPHREPVSFLYGLLIGAAITVCITREVIIRRSPIEANHASSASEAGAKFDTPSAPAPRLTLAEAIDAALVRVADLRNEQAQAKKMSGSSLAKSQHARQKYDYVGEARYKGESQQYDVQSDALVERIRQASAEADRLKRLSPTDWESERGRTDGNESPAPKNTRARLRKR